MLEDGIAELVADWLRMRIEEARQHGSIVCPGMHLEREVVAHHGNLVGTGRLFHERGSARAIGTFEVLEDHDCYRGTFGGPKNRRLVLRSRQRGDQKDSKKTELFVHK